ncbi:hypothetical protein CC80DRAFT_500551 [Byssothecium circinans]|uniref:BTB domain-containing protein n=1 Tax=Byssothecium circinans TaxID=147558 RepID=A0A6A5U8P6_9PLEO|nr:hypothetical protein CC80DRAFT_500551 [Byssothecium circinans]
MTSQTEYENAVVDSMSPTAAIPTYATLTRAPIPIYDPRALDFEILCGDDLYACNRANLATRSPYFQMALFADQALHYNRMVIPETKKLHVRYMMRYLQNNDYYGPVHLNPAKEKEASSARIEFKSTKPEILAMFPEFEDGWILGGDRAVKAHAIIIRHEASHTGDITEGFKMIDLGLVRCTPENLPLEIQIPLLTYINHLTFIRTDVSMDPVFHTVMYQKIATKYMLDDLKPLVLDAFRWGTQAWIKSPVYCSLITAARMILKPLLKPGMSAEDAKEKDWDMANALVQILAENWGWMRYEKELREFMDETKFRPLWVIVEKRVRYVGQFWRERLREADILEDAEEK